MTEEAQGPEDTALEDGEVRVLVALIRSLVGVDLQFSSEESGAVSGIADAVGEDRFWGAMQASYDQELGGDQVWKIVEAVTRQDGREEIYGTLYELSIAGGIDPGEGNLLDKLAKVWELEVSQVEDDSGEEA